MYGLLETFDDVGDASEGGGDPHAQAGPFFFRFDSAFVGKIKVSDDVIEGDLPDGDTVRSGWGIPEADGGDQCGQKNEEAEGDEAAGFKEAEKPCWLALSSASSCFSSLFGGLFCCEGHGEAGLEVSLRVLFVGQ